MAIRLQDKKTRWDALFGNPFEGPSVRLDHDPKILDYNPFYLTVLMHLGLESEPRDLIRTFRTDGASTAYRNLSSPPGARWLAAYLSDFMRYETRPWFLVNGDCDVMARLKFTGRHLRALKRREIAVYFYEPLIPRDGPFFYRRSERTFFYELQWLEDFNRNHDGDLRIVAYVCDYGLGDYLKRWGLYPSIEVRTLDLFVCGYAHEIARGRHPPPGPSPLEASRKFICPNFRYAGYRELMVGYLFGEGFAEDGHISFFHRNENPEGTPHRYPFPLESLPSWPTVRRGLERMRPRLPLTLETTNPAVLGQDQDLPDWDGRVNRRNERLFVGFYSDACLCIVNETRFGMANGEISEKTLLPIYYRRPFVLVGGPHMLRYLKELGFETFDRFWDESYDAIEDPAERMEAIFRLLRDLLSRPLEELRTLVTEMGDVLLRNHLHLKDKFLSRLHSKIDREAREGSRPRG